MSGSVERVTGQLAAAREAARAAAGALLWASPGEVEVQEFYRYGVDLVGMLAAVEQITRHLEKHVSGYADHRILWDDEDEDPARRIAIAAAELRRVRERVTMALRAARRYHTAIGHIAVEVNPDTAGDDDDG